MRTSLIATAIAAALGLASLGSTAAERHHHHGTASNASAAAPGPSLQAELAQRDREIAELKNALAAVSAKVDELEQRTDAQSDVNIQTAKTVETLQDSAKKTDKIEKIVNDTSVAGRFFIDISDLNQKTTNRLTGVSTKSAKQGVGLDVTRGYISVTHNFNEVWSGNITTDFNFIGADAETQLFIKKLYIQGKFSDAFVFHAGSYDTPWVPYVENMYGYRYVDKEILDRLGFGVSADWGVNANGKLADGMFDYSASALNGGGFKNPTRTKSMDFEGRLGFTPIDNLTVAIGGYSGDLGKETETTKALHDASRGDAMIAYAKGNNRLGAEYFRASNYTSVLSPIKDSADGYSVWGSWGFNDKLSVFARYDHAKPNKDTNPSKRDRFYDMGLQWDVRKGIKVAAVYKNESLRDDLSETKTDEFGIFGDISF